MQMTVVLPYAVPGVIIALSMILAFSQPIAGVRLYNTIWILLIAYIARFMNLGYNNISGAISQVDTSLEEAIILIILVVFINLLVNSQTDKD